MAVYILADHQRIGNTRHIEIQVLDKEGGVEVGREVFDWGWDVPLARVRAETILTMDSKYNPNKIPQPGIGSTF